MAALLELLGISDQEERVYRTLLRDPEADLDELALAADVSPTHLRVLFLALEMKGLISHSTGSSSGYQPVFPDMAVEGLIQRRQEELEMIRTYLPQLRREYHSLVGRGNPMEFVEVVSGRNAVASRFSQLQENATEAILVFDKPPYTVPDTVDANALNQMEIQRLSEDIQYRAIYSEDAVAVPGRVQAIREYVKAGEIARVVPELPMKLAIADRRLALMPLIVHSPDPDVPLQVESAIMVHQSSLLDALVTLFEMLWERALPLPFSTDDRKDLGAEADEEDREGLLALLASGLTDEVIARQLGISIRTVRRRIRRLMDDLGAVSRFQAGIQAAKRGWL